MLKELLDARDELIKQHTAALDAIYDPEKSLIMRAKAERDEARLHREIGELDAEIEAEQNRQEIRYFIKRNRNG